MAGIDASQTKCCTKRGQTKSAPEFAKQRNACIQCRNAYSKAYSAANREKCYESTKAWREKKRDQHLAKRRAWSTSERGLQTKRAWLERNRERVYLYNRARKAMRRGMRKTVTIERVRALLLLQRGRCAACRTSLKPGYHIDHVMPISLGGDSSPENLQLLCPTCNCSKGPKHPVEFMQRRGLLL